MPERGWLRERLGLTSGPLLMYLGTLSPRKQPGMLARAAAALARPDVQLVFAGNDMGEERAVRRLVRRLGLEPRTRFTGLLTGPSRYAALAAADVVVYPSYGEVFGLVPLEALQAGTPVIVSNDSGCGEIVSEIGGGLLVAPGNPSLLAAAVGKILDNLPRWRAAAAQAGSGGVQTLPSEPRGRQARRGVSRGPRPGGTPMTQTGVSFVVPVHNGERWLDEVLTAILAQRDGRPFEIIAVDDGSTDGSPRILAARAEADGIRVLRAAKRGAAAAMNQGIREASHPIICLVDQDVVLKPGWLAAVLAPFDDPAVGAVQGRYRHRPAGAGCGESGGDGPRAAVRGHRRGADHHVCTGNSAYRAEALHKAGLFDESFGYGYDNDMSYRLMRAGYALRFCPGARSVHRWRETLRGYLAQQYGQGYGRLDIVWKHPGWVAGDAVSPSMMMAHAPLMAAALASGVASLLLRAAGLPWRQAAALAGVIVAGLALERLVAGVRAAIRHRDAAGLLFVPLHLLRDAAWALAIVAWAARRLAGRGRHPSQSMGRR